jgi:hypothetical protein
VKYYLCPTKIFFKIDNEKPIWEENWWSFSFIVKLEIVHKWVKKVNPNNFMKFIHKVQLKSNKQWETNSLLNTMLVRECEGRKQIMEFFFCISNFFNNKDKTICKQSHSAPNSCKIWKASTTIVHSTCWSICTKLMISFFVSSSS